MARYSYDELIEIYNKRYGICAEFAYAYFRARPFVLLQLLRGNQNG